LFDTAADYRCFLRVLADAAGHLPMRLLAYVVMPNHWHLVLWPLGDRDLSHFMAWATATHVRRWHADHDSLGTGTLYQGRFKAIPVKDDAHFLTVCRYVERNPIRAGLVTQAHEWPWSSASPRNRYAGPTLDEWPVPRPADWAERLNTPESEADLERLRQGEVGMPFGPGEWSLATAARLGWTAGLRRRGRPPRLAGKADAVFHPDPNL
jgi:putative transposase